MLLVISAAACFAQSGVRVGDDYYTPPLARSLGATRLPPSVVWPMSSGAANHNSTLHDMITNTDENQDSGGGCGSCWAWSITTAVEARVAQQKGIVVSLSPQQLVDCTRHVEFGGSLGAMSNNGCGGGYTEATVEWLKMNRYGMCDSSSYPYSGQDQQCASCTGRVRVDDFEVYPRMVHVADGTYAPTAATEARLAEMVAAGPTIALLSIANSTSFGNGDTSDTTCTSSSASGEPPLHSVVVYGYTSTEWLVYNSYGNNWGPHGDGTARIARGSNAYCIGSLKILRISDVSMVEHTQSPAAATVNVHVNTPTQGHTHSTMDDEWGVATVAFFSVLLLCLLPLACYPMTENQKMRRHQRQYDRAKYTQVHHAPSPRQVVVVKGGGPQVDWAELENALVGILGSNPVIADLPEATNEYQRRKVEEFKAKVHAVDARRQQQVHALLSRYKTGVDQGSRSWNGMQRRHAEAQKRALMQLMGAMPPPPKPRGRPRPISTGRAAGPGAMVRCACGAHVLVKAAMRVGPQLMCNVCHSKLKSGGEAWTCSATSNPCDYHMCEPCYDRASS